MAERLRATPEVPSSIRAPIGLIDLAEAKQIIGAVFCITCQADTIPMPDGRCGFCDRDPATGYMSEARARQRARDHLRNRMRINSATYRQRRREAP